MHEVPVSPIQCCQVTFVHILQKPHQLFHNLCHCSECQSLIFLVFLALVLVPQGTHRSRDASSGSTGFPFPAQLLPFAPPASLPEEISSIFLSPNYSQVVLWIQHCYEKETIQCGACWGNSTQEPLPVGVDLFYCWVLPPSACKQVNHRWEGGSFLLHGFFGVKDPLKLEKPSGLRSCPASINR